ncbi:MAG: nicotinamide-nucleotide amidohydrolase family protein, partial [Nitrospirota bacterium]
MAIPDGGEADGGYIQALSDSLGEFGLELMSVSLIALDEKEAENAIRLALSRSLMVVLSGRQGQERIEEFSRKVLARALGKRLILHPDLKDKAALFPNGARLLTDLEGTPDGHRCPAGFWLEHDGRYVVSLLGPVNRRRQQALRDIIPPELARALSRGRGRKFAVNRTIRCYGINAENARELLENIPVSDGNIRFSASVEGLNIKASARADTYEKAQKLLLELCAEIVRKVGDYFYGTDGEELQDAVARLLTERKLTIATAESCTGGLVAKRLTDVAGSSVYMERGVVTYSNISKEELLSVPAEVFMEHGAVSGETAKFMAEGIRKSAGTDIGLSITGIAGPGGGTAEKPVGLVYIGLATPAGAT